MRVATVTGCLGGCALLLGLPTLAIVLVGGLLAALLGGLGAVAGGAAAQPIGPAYYATTGGPPSIHDLGFGSSDAARLDRAIAAIQPDSPLAGRGALILRLAQQFGVDPLLLVGLWQAESQLCTDGLNTPRWGNWNCGNLIWEAAAPYAARYGCERGETSLHHLWARCTAPEGGLGVWFAYVATAPAYAAARPNFFAFVRVYNPCSDPQNAANGFPCGDAYGQNILATVRRAAGPPVVYQPAISPVTVVVVPGEYVFPVAGYTGRIELHHGRSRAAADLFAPPGTPVIAMHGGWVTSAGYDPAGGWHVAVDGDDGLDYYYAHLIGPPLVRAGQRVIAGTQLGGVGETGNAAGTGPHLHLGIGPAIQAGTGPDGGGGTGNFDAVGLLRRVQACCVVR